MAQYLGLPVDREGLLAYVGDISQIGGVRRYTLTEGRSAGVDAVDVRTGAGLCYTVLPGRGMDIAWADLYGQALSHITHTGVTHAALYQNGGREWLRGFFAGLLTTCGLSNAGPHGEGLAGDMHGLHGRISNIAAENVLAENLVDEGGMRMRVSGRMRETALFSENLRLSRVVESRLGENSFLLRDTVENLGYQRAPLMLLYHMNFGYPLLSASTRLIGNISGATPRDAEAQPGASTYPVMHAPVHGYAEQVFELSTHEDAEGFVWAGLYNETLELAATVKFRKAQLPRLTLWKQLAEQDYVVGIEPGNCFPEGQRSAEENGVLEWLEPGQKREVEIEFRAAQGAEAKAWAARSMV